MFSDIFLLYSTAPQLRYPSCTIFAAMLFWIGSKKIELSYFLTPSYAICSFFPPVKLFIAHMTRYVSTIRPRSQSALDIVLNKLIIIIRFFESELLMKINQFLYQNFGGDIGLLWKSPFTLKGNFDKHFDWFSLKFLIITIQLFKTILRADWDLGITGILALW